MLGELNITQAYQNGQMESQDFDGNPYAEVLNPTQPNRLSLSENTGKRLKGLKIRDKMKSKIAEIKAERKMKKENKLKKKN